MSRCHVRHIITTAFATTAMACSSGYDPPEPAPSPETADAGVQVDSTEIVSGVADRGRDPAVVAIDIGGEGALLRLAHRAAHRAHRASLRVEHEREVECPPKARRSRATARPKSLRSSSVTTRHRAELVARGKRDRRAEGRRAVRPGHRAIVLDRDVTGVSPLAVRARRARKGRPRARRRLRRDGRQRTAGAKLLREHVKVDAVTAAEFEVGEATCRATPAAPRSTRRPARSSASSRAAARVRRRRRAQHLHAGRRVLPLVEEALRDGEGARGRRRRRRRATRRRRTSDAGRRSRAPTKPATDVGASCTKGADCSTGVCVERRVEQVLLAHVRHAATAARRITTRSATRSRETARQEGRASRVSSRTDGRGP